MNGCLQVGFSHFFDITAMTKVAPFKAIRPVRDKAHLVASRPFYTYEQSILEAKLKDNPFTFLHIINPEFNSGEYTEPNSMERFEKVRATFDRFMEEGILREDEKPCLYLYRQTQNGHSYTGIIGGASIDDYENNVIKKHEETLTAREQMFATYLDIVEFNAEPVLLIHPADQDLKLIFQRITSRRSEYEFTTTDRITHELWIVDNPVEIQKIQSRYETMKNVYIADGHHRSSSSNIYGQQKRKDDPEGPHLNFLSYFIPDNEVDIIAFNRLVKDLNGLSHEDFIQKMQSIFEVEKLEQPQEPEQKHHITLYLDHTWYLLKLKPEHIDNNNNTAIDADILTRKVLDPILGIKDLKTDNRIDFINAKDGVKSFQKIIDQGKARAGFALFPVKVRDLIEIADHDGIMPPKSTWIEPKLRSGLTIYSLKND